LAKEVSKISNYGISVWEPLLRHALIECTSFLMIIISYRQFVIPSLLSRCILWFVMFARGDASYRVERDYRKNLKQEKCIDALYLNSIDFFSPFQYTQPNSEWNFTYKHLYNLVEWNLLVLELFRSCIKSATMLLSSNEIRQYTDHMNWE
jgi:hypothetical protein